MKNPDIKKILTPILMAISVAIASIGCSGSGEDAGTPKAKVESTIKCPNTDCKYARPGDPETLTIVETCPDCGTKLKQ